MTFVETYLRVPLRFREMPCTLFDYKLIQVLNRYSGTKVETDVCQELLYM